MSALATPAATVPTRRRRAGAVATEALRGGLLAAAVAAAAWLLAGIIASTVFGLLLIATITVAALTAMGRNISAMLWIGLALAWAVVGLERWAVQGNGGVWVGIAAWLGVVAGARRAGMPKWALPLLAYPAISAAIAVVADQSLLHPWGISWLWVAAALGPPLGAKVLLAPTTKP
jgi:hypothetical protein